MEEQQHKKEITVFAETNFRNQRKSFGIKRDDRRRHVYIIGKTGMGKTTLLENMIISDVIHDEGCCYIDPHGDTAEKILDFIPSHRLNDVIYFNPADVDWPIAFNVLEAVDEKSKHLIASGIVGIFKKQFADSWGPRLEYILRNAVLALLDYPGSTLLGIMRILVDNGYRKKVVEKITDPVVRSFWTNEFTKWNDRVLQEVISPIQNKVGQFLSNFLIRNIVGQVKSTIDMRDIIDNKKILIMNLSKGRIGEDTMQLLGSMAVTKLYLAAMSRVDIPEEKRNDFYLFVDEFQNFATDSFADILSEARKYRLDLTMAHQFISQLPENVSDAVFGNVGTLVSFRVGAADAELLVKEFAPTFTEEDLVNLPAFNIYLKLMIDGISSDPFSAATLPPLFDDMRTDNADKVLKVSRERYAHSRSKVEDKINRWSAADLSGMSSGNDASVGKLNNNHNKNNQNKPQNNKNKKPKYDVVCSKCGKDTQVPFKPDKSRPVLCPECFSNVTKGEDGKKDGFVDLKKVKEMLKKKEITLDQAVKSDPKPTRQSKDDKVNPSKSQDNKKNLKPGEVARF